MNIKKKILSLMLVICMIFTTIPMTAAMAFAETGELNLTLKAAPMKISNQTNLKAALMQGSETKYSFDMTGDSEYTGSVKGISNGEYTLKITGDKFITYSQELEFMGDAIDLTLYDSPTINIGSESKNGVMAIGDVNGDNKIDDSDANLIVDGISNGTNLYDLNGDSKTNIVDLAYSVRNQAGNFNAQVQKRVSPAALVEKTTVTHTDDTEATVVSDSGKSINEVLFSEDKTDAVQLTPKTNGGQVAQISEENPVSLTLDVETLAPEVDAITISPPMDSYNVITAGTFTVEDEEGNLYEAVLNENSIAGLSTEYALADSSNRIFSDKAIVISNVDASKAEIIKNSDGGITINIGKKVAIKKVTIKVTGSTSGKLAEIAKVEFLEDFADRIQEPQLSIPSITSVSNTESDGQGYKSITISWNKQNNITGYEVKILGEGYSKTATTTEQTYTFMGDSFNGTVKSWKTYNIQVRSINGDWKSDWSTPYYHVVTCNKKPPTPNDGLSVTANVNSATVSWKALWDTEGYVVYYKKATDAEYRSVITANNSYTFNNLVGGETYNFYIVAYNRHGYSGNSSILSGIPKTAGGVQMPKYKLINVNDENGKAGTHITSIKGTDRSYTIYLGNGNTVNQSNATTENWKVIVDNDPNSYVYIGDWDSGVSYGNFRGPIIQLDKAYTIDTVRFSTREGSGDSTNNARIGYKDAENNNAYKTVDVSFSQKKDSQNKAYYELVFNQPIKTDYLEIRTQGSAYSRVLTFVEVKIYEYDSIENEVKALFTDEKMNRLVEGVTIDKVNDLITRVNTPDEVSGEYHPHKATIMDNLNYALKALQDGIQEKPKMVVDTTITAKSDGHQGMAQSLSDYQPLGYVAEAGETVVIYVESKGHARGQNTYLNLIATQYYPEVSGWSRQVATLKAGRNEITIPTITSQAKERGGALYIQYTGNKNQTDYTVTVVSGGDAIPMLNVRGLDDTARTEAIKTYVANLESYVANIQNAHEINHSNGDNVNVKYDYSATNCILNSTEILMENMMYSLPATEILRGLGNGTLQEKATKLDRTIQAMEQEVKYFYQFKGFNENATDADRFPVQYLNIRYCQMFTGAFMYAAGKHIGIGFGSVTGLCGTNPIVTDENGKYKSGNYSGWGIAHEIGHCINSSAYQRVEVTNNVFSQLANVNANAETNSNFRTTYAKVYDAVVSGTTGHTGDLAVQLAMYWQLHLAYDDGYSYKMYDTIEEQKAALFYARLDSYLRDKTKAPYQFTATGGDDLLMQASCAAANADVLDFFRAWGFKPSNATIEYASQYKKETRKIQYIDDNSRLYRIENKPGMSEGTKITASITNANNSRINGNKVEILLSNDNKNNDAMLGYEIRRNGKVVGFVTADKKSFTDILTTDNNKAFVYTIIGIDRLLNETEVVTLPEVKIAHDGAIDKTGWTVVATNMKSRVYSDVVKHEDDPDKGLHDNCVEALASEKDAMLANLFDNNIDGETIYLNSNFGSCNANNRPYLTIDMGKVKEVSAIKLTPVSTAYNSTEGVDSNGKVDGLIEPNGLYKMRVFTYKIEISMDGTNWTTVRTGNAYPGANANTPEQWVGDNQNVVFSRDAEGNFDYINGSYSLYFTKDNDESLYTYDARYIRLTSTGMSAMALSEIDVLGPTGDNVELIEGGYGKLSSDFVYSSGTDAEGKAYVIPKDAIVFYGEYKGDPGYNVVQLRDQNNVILGGQQIILADVPENGKLGETSSGRWFFWFESEEELAQLTPLTSVQAQLYRVNNAMTLEGERMTASSLHFEIPETMPSITIISDETATLNEFTVASLDSFGVEAIPVSAYADDYTNFSYHAFAVTNDTNSQSVNATTWNFDIASQEKIAIYGSMMLPTGQENVNVLWDNNDCYHAYRYNSKTGKLDVYAVARNGYLTDAQMSGTIRIGQAVNVVTGETILLDSDYGLVNSANMMLNYEKSGKKKHTKSSEALDNGANKGEIDEETTIKDAGAKVVEFKDVTQNSYCYNAVQWAVENGITTGMSDSSFAPEKSCTRAQAIVFLWRSAGCPNVELDDNKFGDVSIDSYYYNAVQWAIAKGITGGTSDVTFSPEGTVNRAQIVTFLYRMQGENSVGDKNQFSDINESDYYANAVKWASKNNITSGTTNTTFSPNADCLRGQIVTFLYRNFVE